MKNGCEIMTLDSVCKFLRENDNYLILTHASPDGDTIGSAVALSLLLKQLGKRSRTVFSEPVGKKYSYLADCTGGDFTPAAIIAVDVADIKLLDGDCKAAGVPDLCIDHHPTNTQFAGRLYLESDAAACCECVYHIAEHLRADITADIANALYTGITTDTGCFKYSNVTANTHKIAAELIEKGAAAAEINRLMFETNSRAKIEMEKAALETIKYYFGGKCAVMTVTLDMINRTGCEKSELEGITPIPRTIEGVVVGVTLKETEKGVFKVSFRTHEPIDACKIAALLGGGGHMRAAGCRVKGTAEEAEKLCLQAVGKMLVGQ